MPTHEATPDQRRLHALRVYRQKGTYAKAAAELGVSKKRAFELVKAGLRLELAAAKQNDDEGDTTNE